MSGSDFPLTKAGEQFLPQVTDKLTDIGKTGGEKYSHLVDKIVDAIFNLFKKK